MFRLLWIKHKSGGESIAIQMIIETTITTIIVAHQSTENVLSLPKRFWTNKHIVCEKLYSSLVLILTVLKFNQFIIKI